MKAIKTVGLATLAVLAAAVAFIYSGFYPMGADVPHNALTYWALETLRERSVARAARDIEVPSLDDPALLLAGGPDYNDMCAGCHLKPGKTESDFSIGLYPKPPNLASPGHVHGDAEAEARRNFWIIKHGIKASGMPAWGPTHDDERIWAMVAFLQRLPELTLEQYQILTAREAGDANQH
jgi:mono/diheme cytochrome c family protein